MHKILVVVTWRSRVRSRRIVSARVCRTLGSRWWRARLDAADERVRRSKSRRQTDNGKIESKDAAERHDFEGTVQRRDRLDHIVEVPRVVDANPPGGVYRAGVGERQKTDESKKECRRPHPPQTVTTGRDKSVMTTARAPLLETHRLHLAVAIGRPRPTCDLMERRRRWQKKVRLTQRGWRPRRTEG